jgi:hypothetical protein
MESASFVVVLAWRTRGWHALASHLQQYTPRFRVPTRGGFYVHVATVPTCLIILESKFWAPCDLFHVSMFTVPLFALFEQ